MSINSGGIIGTPFHSHWPKSENHILVKTLVFGTPPLDSMKSLAFNILGASGDTPESFRAK